jgi:hypothetical protein
MRLAELRPRWISRIAGRHGMGLTFLCPHCATEQLEIFFENPADGGPADPEPGPRWTLHEKGRESFEGVTVSWSIRVSGHWHGMIENGEIVTVPNPPE